MFGIITAAVIGAGAGASLVKSVSKITATTLRTIDKCVYWETKHSAYGVEYQVRSSEEFALSDDALEIMERICRSHCGERWKSVIHLWLKGIRAWAKGGSLKSEFKELEEFGINSDSLVELLLSKVPEEDKALLLDFGTLLGRLP